jgi:hypothetical protein
MLGSDQIGAPNQSGSLDPSLSYRCDRSLAGRHGMQETPPPAHNPTATSKATDRPLCSHRTVAADLLAHPCAHSRTKTHVYAYMAPTSRSNTISTYSLYSTLMMSVKCLTLSNLACYLGCFLSSSFYITSNSVGAYSN